jgi:hypothetical protein
VRAEDVRRVRVERGEEGSQLRADAGVMVAGFDGYASVGQHMQMVTFGLLEAQCACERVEHLAGDVNISPLLKPGVPGDAYSREGGDLFASQSWSAPPTPGRESCFFG